MAKRKKVRVGLIGIGFMGKMHWDCYRANRQAQIVAICDVDRKKLKGDWSGIAGNIEGKGAPPVNLSGVATYSKIEDLVGDPDVDLVDVTLPSDLHIGAVVKALKANKHVLCEKPMALKLTEANRMVAAAKKSKGYFMVAQCIRFWPAYAAAKKLIAARKFGKVRTATFFRISPTPAWSDWLINDKRSGSAIIDLHIHDSDFVQYLFGMPKAVTSVGASGKASRGIDHVVTQYHYPKSKVEVCVAEGGWIVEPTHPFNMQFRIICDKATLEFNFDRDVETLYIHHGGRKPRAEKMKVGAATGWSEEIDYYVDCIARRSKPKVVTPEDARNALKIVLAEQKSVRGGGKRVAV